MSAEVKVQAICWCWETFSSRLLLLIQVNDKNEPISGLLTLIRLNSFEFSDVKETTPLCLCVCVSTPSRGQLRPRNEWPVQPVPGGSWLWGRHFLEFLLLHGEIQQRFHGWWSAQKNRWGSPERSSTLCGRYVHCVSKCRRKKCGKERFGTSSGQLRYIIQNLQYSIVLFHQLWIDVFVCCDIPIAVIVQVSCTSEYVVVFLFFRVGSSPVKGTGPSATCTFSHRQHGELRLLPQVGLPWLYVPSRIFILSC